MALDAAWIKAHKWPLLASVAGVGGLAWYRSRQSSTSSTTAATTSGSNQAAYDAGTFDSSALDQYDQLASAISNLNDQVGTLTTNEAGEATASLPPASGGQGVNPGTYPAGVKTYSLGSGYSITTAGRPGGNAQHGFVDFLKNGKFVGTYKIPATGKTQIAGTPFSIGEAGDKAVGALDVFNGNHFVGAYQT